MKKKTDPQFNVIDDIIISDEWDHVRYLIGEHLKGLEVAGEVRRKELPFFAHFEHEIKSKLIKAGFRKEIIDNQKRFGAVLNGLNNQGKTIYGARDGEWKYPPFAYGYPADVVILNDDKSMYWIKPDIEAALRTLESITIMKGLLLNKEAIKVYLRSFELTINLSRAGLILKMVKAEADKQTNRQATMALYQKIIYFAIKKVLNNAPTEKKWTLGYVMFKFNVLNKGKTFYDPKTTTNYSVCVDQEAGEDGIRITGLDNDKSTFYKKRSLQKFIDEYKRTHLKITL